MSPAPREAGLETAVLGLLDSVRRNATIDWSEKEQVRARMRASIRRLLTRHGYPPDKQPTAIDLVMHQAELFAAEVVA